jgi:hypothetical protein
MWNCRLDGNGLLTISDFAFSSVEHGKQQSPIEIDPKLLLFDPNLTNLNINTASVSIVIYNLNFRNTCDIW